MTEMEWSNPLGLTSKAGGFRAKIRTTARESESFVPLQTSLNRGDRVKGEEHGKHLNLPHQKYTNKQLFKKHCFQVMLTLQTGSMQVLPSVMKMSPVLLHTLYVMVAAVY